MILNYVAIKRFRLPSMKWCFSYIKYDEKYMLDSFSYIKYDEKYMPELFLTLPELQNYQNVWFLTICVKMSKMLTIVESSKTHFPLLRCQIGYFLTFFTICQNVLETLNSVRHFLNAKKYMRL